MNYYYQIHFSLIINIHRDVIMTIFLYRSRYTNRYSRSQVSSLFFQLCNNSIKLKHAPHLCLLSHDSFRFQNENGSRSNLTSQIFPQQPITPYTFLRNVAVATILDNSPRHKE
uniref:Uncharacterized protein n=1 Tax=Schizaphis graminum TaxID=13262 RepID=A0A2S2NR76_SCHGA